MTLALSAVAAAPAADGSPNPLVSVGRAIPAAIARLATRLVPGSQTVHFEVALAANHPGQLAELASSVSNPASPLYRHYLTAGQFHARFAPRPAEVDSVSHYLAARGLVVQGTAPDGLALEVEAKAAQVDSALSTRLAELIERGRSVMVPLSPVKVPAGLAGDIDGVLGLSQLARAAPAGLGYAVRPTGRTRSTRLSREVKAHQNAVAGEPTACSASDFSGAYNADDVAGFYGINNLWNDNYLGQGQTIALFELAGYSPSDIAAYQSCFGTDAAVHVTNVDGGASVGSGTIETTSDIEDLIGLAPKATIDVYEAPNGAQGIYDGLAAMVNADTASVLNNSWGLCEPDVTGAGLMGAENTLLEQAATQGQTVFAASGDAGSDGCYAPPQTDTSLAVSDPSSQPYVTGVGGTSITSPGTPPGQQVWNDSLGASGGGISQRWPMPSWQKGPGVIESGISSGSPCGNTGGYCREVPDVAALGSITYAIYCTAGDCAPSGGFLYAGGTSLASPTWAAMTSLIDQRCGSSPVGFLNPALYAEAAGGGDALTPVTVGNNDYMNTHGSLYSAGPGYNMATGLGTPLAGRLAAYLCPVTRVAGATRIGTSLAAANLVFSGAHSASAAVLARDDEFPDALAGVPLAAQVHGPLLLTSPTSLDSVVASTLTHVLTSGATVYLLGGTSALSPAVASAVSQLGFKVVRLGGADRAETAVDIANELANLTGGPPKVVFLATGDDFADALSAGPAAASQGGVILLTDGAKEDPATAAYLAAHPGLPQVAVGGPAAAADPRVQSFVGSTRYGTSALVATHYFGGATAVALASGANFPDALSGGPVAALAGAPMLLVPPTGALPAPIETYLNGRAGHVTAAFLFGGVDAVASGVEGQIAKVLLG
jgi:hypothetical protein